MACVQLVTEAGGSYLEAPVSGSKAPAEQGTLIFLCGGEQALFDKSAPILDVMGKAKLFLGKVGQFSTFNGISIHCFLAPTRTPVIGASRCHICRAHMQKLCAELAC